MVLWSPPRWIAPFFGLAALVLVPWVVLLVNVLPAAHRASHWNVAWAGFDVLLALVLLGVALAAWRRSPWLQSAAAAAATLLVVDAWFDVLTSSGGRELAVAIVEAVAVELPLAALCFLLARDTERRLVEPLLERARSEPRLRRLAAAPARPSEERDRRRPAAAAPRA